VVTVLERVPVAGRGARAFRATVQEPRLPKPHGRDRQFVKMFLKGGEFVNEFLKRSSSN